MSFIQKLGLSLLSGLLLALAWPLNGFAPLIFVAFVPLLIISDNLLRQKKGTMQITLFAYTSFVLWNALTTYWIWFSTPDGAVMAIGLLSLFFTVVFTAFYFTWKYLPKNWGLLSLPIYWITFEKFHLNWDLTWPWLTLGNVFSEYYTWIQWYEYTGVFGGSTWIFAVNILVFIAIKKYSKTNYKPAIAPAVSAVLLVAIPVAISLTRYSSYNEKINPVNVVVIQPNIDPYNEKFLTGSYIQQTNKFIQLAKPLLTADVDFVVGPETALSAGIEEEDPYGYKEVEKLQNMLLACPKAALVTGATTYRQYKTWETPPASARKNKSSGHYYDYYNTAMQLDTSKQPVQYSHKSKLVPGAERMPFSKYLGFLEKYAMDFGGTTGTLGIDTTQNAFTNRANGITIAPSICYESVYGEYMGGFIQKGAQLVFIITNDGWWQNSPGHRQHASYARLRAIEARRSVARSANTGISCFINQRGDVLQATPYWQTAAIKQTLNANSTLTFYTKHGDYIALLCTVLLLPLLITAILLKGLAVRKRVRTKKQA
jgi:apolipoprotein N-acyltransferase